MPSPVFPTAYQVEVRGMLFGQLVENVWHVQGPNPFDAAVAETVASIFQTGYVGIQAALSQDYSISEVFVHNLAGGASGEFTLAIVPAQNSGIVQDSMPGNVSFCVSLRSALSGRRFRGRKYFAGLGEGDVVGNEWNSDRRDTILTGVADLMSALTANTTPLSVFSPTGLTLVPIVAATAVDLVVDSQRRRLTGRGR